jgi:hypothetical protein
MGIAAGFVAEQCWSRHSMPEVAAADARTIWSDHIAVPLKGEHYQ